MPRIRKTKPCDPKIILTSTPTRGSSWIEAFLRGTGAYADWKKQYDQV